MHIFYIDDDADDREVFAEALKAVSPSISCTYAENGKEALRILQATKTQPDIMFVDVNMPAMNGRQFLLEIKNNPSLKSIPVVMYSTSSRPQDVQEYLSIGARQFVIKPGSFHELCDMLREVLSNNARPGQ